MTNTENTQTASTGPSMPRALKVVWTLFYFFLGMSLLYGITYWKKGSDAEFFGLLFWVAVGALVGYATNWLALKMLFKPKREIRFGPGWLFPNRVPPGLIVERQPQIAETIGEFSKKHLLSKQAVRRHFTEAGARQRLADFLFEKSTVWRDLANPYVDRLAAFLSSRQFRAKTASQVDCHIRRYSSRKLRDFITMDERRRLAASLGLSLAKEFGGAEGRRAIGCLALSYLEGLKPGGGNPLPERLGDWLRKGLPGMIEAQAGSVSRYLNRPDIAVALQKALSRELRSGIRDTFGKFLKRTLPIPGLTNLTVEPLAQFLALDSSIDNHLRKKWPGWMLRLSAALADRKDDIAGVVYDEGKKWLRRAHAEGRLEALTEEITSEATRQIADALNQYLASDAAVDCIAARLDELSSRSLDEICPELIDKVVERVVGEIENLLDSFLVEKQGRDRLYDMVEQASLSTLGEGASPWAVLSEEDRRRICDRLARFADIQFRRQIPPVLDRLHLDTMVEREIRRFTPDEIEQVAVETASKEMKYIEYIGALAGSVTTGFIQLVRILLS